MAMLTTCRLHYQPLFGKMSPHSSPRRRRIKDRTRETAWDNMQPKPKRLYISQIALIKMGFFVQTLILLVRNYSGKAVKSLQWNVSRKLGRRTVLFIYLFYLFSFLTGLVTNSMQLLLPRYLHISTIMRTHSVTINEIYDFKMFNIFTSRWF